MLDFFMRSALSRAEGTQARPYFVWVTKLGFSNMEGGGAMACKDRGATTGAGAVTVGTTTGAGAGMGAGVPVSTGGGATVSAGATTGAGAEAGTHVEAASTGTGAEVGPHARAAIGVGASGVGTTTGTIGVAIRVGA